MAAVEFRGRVMASDLHIIVVLPEIAVARWSSEGHLAETVAFLNHLERSWSRFLPTSDVSRINRLGPAGGGRISVDRSTIALLTAMVDGFERTAGRFDPTMVRAVIAEGYAASHVDPDLVTPMPAASVMGAAVSLHDLETDAPTSTVMVPAGLTLDPGGIGKGLAADLAVAHLIEHGASGALVGIGGDLAMAGTPTDDVGWTVNVERPDRSDGILCSLAVSGGGVATSSTRSRRWTVDGIERHHQIDPRTERCSTTDLASATVIAPTGWLAEVHATAALASGSTGVVAYLEGHGLSGIAVGDEPASGAVLLTADLADLELRLASVTR